MSALSEETPETLLLTLNNVKRIKQHFVTQDHRSQQLKLAKVLVRNLNRTTKLHPGSKAVQKHTGHST